MVFDGIERPAALPGEFRGAAETPAPAIAVPQIMVTLPIDADVLAFLQRDTEPPDWQGRINDLLRFHVETTLQIQAEWETDEGLHQSEPQP